MAGRQNHLQLRPLHLLTELCLRPHPHEVRIDSTLAEMLLHQLSVEIVSLQVNDLECSHRPLKASRRSGFSAADRVAPVIVPGLILRVEPLRYFRKLVRILRGRTPLSRTRGKNSPHSFFAPGWIAALSQRAGIARDLPRRYGMAGAVGASGRAGFDFICSRPPEFMKK
ncbi:hypothetical protein BH20VER1_BH20VER1_22350 [soil metagenome]